MTFSLRVLPLFALGLASLCQGLALAGSPLYRISVNGMVCSFCAQGIEKRLKALPSTESVHIDLSKGMVEITARPGATLDPATLKKAVRDAGYEVRGIEGPSATSTGAPGTPN